jgi:CheY-like chemotaxis protein
VQFFALLAAAATGMTNGQTHTRILVVDDNKDAANTLARVFRMLGYDPVVAYDGASGLAAFLEHRPPYAFLDIGMPGMDGFELARHIRQQAGPDGPTLVAVTGFGQEGDKRRSREAGFDHHLIKPAELAELEDILQDDR